MTLRFRAIKNYRPINVPVSYRVLDQDKLSDARNVFNNEGVQETRYGIKRFNSTSLGGAPLSLSFFKDNSSNIYRLAKVGTVLYKVNASGAHTSLKSSLTSTTKHRAVTFNNRHIVAIEGDGLFSYNGTTFTQLGQAAPTGVSAVIAAGGTLVDTNVYKVGVTFYSSSTGFESNYFETNSVTAAGANKQIDVSSIPATAANATIDKVRIYLKNVTANSSYLFVTELSLGTTTYSITAPSVSTVTPPTTHAAPISGGGKYLSVFGNRLAYAGNSSFPSDVFFSEEDLPDAYDDTATQLVLNIPGAGPITGLATGYFDDSHLDPYLVAFKKNSISVYSELGGIPKLATFEGNVGCVSAETIKVVNGFIYFMSENGWRAINRGRLVVDSKEKPYSLGNGDIDDIFTRVGWNYELNSANYANFFSAYFVINSQYLTFVSEGANNTITKAYVYEEKIAGFRVFEFKTVLTCAADGETDAGNSCFYLGDNSGYLFYYSSKNSRYDEDSSANQQSIPAYIIFSYILPGEDTNSYNFKTLTLRAFSSQNPLEVRCFANFDRIDGDTYSYDFPSLSSDFTLDVSQLDVDTIGDERVPVTAMGDVSLTGETLSVGIYQDVISGNIGLISAQVALNKNGNRNL